MFFTVIGFIFCVAVVGYALWFMFVEFYNFVVYQLYMPVDMDDVGAAAVLLVIIAILGATMTAIFVFAPWELSWTVNLEVK